MLIKGKCQRSLLMSLARSYSRACWLWIVHFTSARFCDRIRSKWWL